LEIHQTAGGKTRRLDSLLKKIGPIISPPGMDQFVTQNVLGLPLWF